MSENNSFELILVRAKEDKSDFSKEYQEELAQFAKEAKAASQRAFAMDAIDGGGGPLGEFVFNHAEGIITALSTVAGVWLTARSGRKLRLKVGDVEMEANSVEEIEKMVKYVKSIKYTKK